jgi:probable F420-dependent oxidoreductase
MQGLGLILAPQQIERTYIDAMKAEDAGFDILWNSELYRSIFVPLAALAPKTENIKLGAGIALAFVRSPLSIALTSLDMDEVSNGRFILGLGPGVRRLIESWHNAVYGAPAAHLREYVELVRLIMRKAHLGESIIYQGKYYDINIKNYKRVLAPVRNTIPIFLAGVGPLMCKTAGEVADGWMGHMLGSTRWFTERIQPNILTGLQKSGRNQSDFQFHPVLACAVDTDPQKARRALAGTVAFYASVRTYTEFFAYHGFEKETIAIQNAFHQGNVQDAINAVPDSMVDALGAAGTKDEVRKKVREYLNMTGNVTVGAPMYLIDDAEIAHYQTALIDAMAD